MPVCLHCGELAPEGALFCAKCGYTLPQVDAPGAAPAPALPAPPPSMPGAAPPPPPPAPTSASAFVPIATPAYLVAIPPGATGPIPPPPSGKYCVHCRTIIARAAAYCPVCQQPQP